MKALWFSTTGKLRVIPLVLALLLLSLGSRAHSAELTCARHYWDVELEKYGLTAQASVDADGKSNLCTKVLLNGPISSDDVHKFQKWLTDNPFTRGVLLRSPGGSVDAAMAVGRIIRARFLFTEAEDHGRNYLHPTERNDCRRKGCCLSACVLLLAAGAYFEAGNIGLHRPTATDFAAVDYATVKERLETGLKRIRTYLAEMEISPKLYDAMLAVPSDQMLLLDEQTAYPLLTGMPYDPQHPSNKMPASIFEWARAGCDGLRRTCIFEKISAEAVRIGKTRAPARKP